MTKQRVRGIFLMVSLMAFRFSLRNFFLPLFYLRRLPRTNWGFPLPCVGLLIVRPVLEPNHPDHRADLRRALQLWAGCTNLPQPRGTSPHHIFGVSSISSPCLCLYRKWLLPRLLLAFSPSTPSAQDHLLPLPLVPPSVPL